MYTTSKILLFGFLALFAGACMCPMHDGNGIYVGSAKVYDNQTLQLQLQTLSGRLSQLTGINQNSVTAGIGTLQGASSTQVAGAFQLNGAPTPGVLSTVTNGTPSVQNTVGGTTSAGAPSTVVTTGTNPSTVTTTTGATSQNSNQTVTSTPSNTVQTQTTTPSMAPVTPQLPTTTMFTLPSTFAVSSLDTLNEEMQLSYQLINLQLLLQGSLSDDYGANGFARRHVTLGFPISISTPPQYRGDAAEVRVSVCNPIPKTKTGLTALTPTLQTIIPQEKTYNVASLVSKSAAFSASAVIANVVNVGGNFFWNRQTYYLVKAQDTVALQLTSTDKSCPDQSDPITFAWQFRPVLGQKTVEQGMRWTFAQISYTPSLLSPGDDLKSPVKTVTCWKKFDQKSGVVGQRIDGSCNWSAFAYIPTYYDTTAISGIDETDNGDGSLTIKVYGDFPTGTRVGLGDTYQDVSTAGFENTGTFLRFTAPAQLVAVRGARLISPDGTEQDIALNQQDAGPSYSNSAGDTTVFGDFSDGIWWLDGSALPKSESDVVFQAGAGDLQSHLVFVRTDGSTCRLPGRVQAPDGDSVAKVVSYNDSLLQVTLPLWQCIEVGPTSGPSALVVLLNGKAFGLSDAPFKSRSKESLSFLVPNSLLQGQRRLKLKRLFLNNAYETTYYLAPMDTLFSNIFILNSSKNGVTLGITGSGLKDAGFLLPRGLEVKKRRDTYLEVFIGSTDLSTAKQIVLKAPNRSPTFIPLPTVPKPTDDSRFSIAVLESDQNSTTFAITGAKGSDLQDATLVWPLKIKPNYQDDTNLWFSLTKAQVLSTKQIAIQVPPEAPVLVALPKDGSDSSQKVSLTPDTVGIPVGSTSPYKIAGTNLQLVSSITYLDKPLPFSLSADTSITIAQLPATLAAVPGSVTLQVMLTDGSKQTFNVKVNAPG